MTETPRLPIDPTRVSLVTALVLLLHSGDPNPTQVTFWLALGVVLGISTRRPVGLAAIGVLLVAAIALRLAWSDHTGSDVLRVTKDAIDRMLAGLNPYGIGYQSSKPPGSPFPYGPFALFMYLPFHNAAFVLELLSGFVVAAILATEGRLVGLAVYGLAPIVVSTATDGSNDTTLGLLILVAFMTARRAPIAASLVLASAAAFKLSALAFVPGFVAWAGVRAAMMFVAGSVIAWSPVLGNWGIASFLESARLASEVHRSTHWSFGLLIKELADARVDAIDQLRYVVGGLIGLVGLRFRRSLDGVILVGVLVYLVTLYGGNWATYAYLGGVAPIVCWRLDDWLGFRSRPLWVRVGDLRLAWSRRRAPLVPPAGDGPAGDPAADGAGTELGVRPV